MIDHPCLLKCMKSITFVFIFLCFAHITIAYTQPQNAYLAKLIKQVKQQKLYQQPSWLALLHYNKKQEAQQFSFATSKRFFIAPDGRQNAEQELIATLHSLFQTQSEQQATACKFPARYHWLKQSLSIDDRKIAKQPLCQQYQTWRKQMKAQSVTLVFPGSYMNAPSSVFGHTLLRIDSSGNDPAHLLSHAISFAAKIPDGTGSFAYAMGGLNGTFPGRYQHALYHQKIKTYGRIENRDIWEYKLNLNPQEQERLLQHIWEIKGIAFRYFFAKENCSLRLLELLEVARTNSHLTDHFDMYAIPADTIRILVKLGFVSSVKYRPSASTRLHAEINALNGNEQAIALQISHHEAALASSDFVKLAEDRKAKVIQLAYRYLKWKQLDAWKKQDNSLPYHLIQQLELHPVSTQTIIAEPVRPDQGHASKRLKLSSGYEHKSYIQLGSGPYIML